MNISHFFIDRPIFAAVVAIFITLIGGFSYFALPVSQYPEVAPPTVVVRAVYPGASAQVVSESVATPLEQQINGVENMLYMVSEATGDGNLNLTITFGSSCSPHGPSDRADRRPPRSRRGRLRQR